MMSSTRHPVDARCAVVLQHQPPRHRQHVEPIDPVIQGVKPKLRFLLGLSPQLPPQLRDVQDELYAVPHFRFVRQFGPTVNAHLLRSGMDSSKRRSPHLVETHFRQGSFAPPALPGFTATMSPSDSRTGRPAGYLFPPGVDLRPTRRWSPARVSQVPDCSVDARCPLSTPESPTAAHVRCFTVDSRLHHSLEGWPLSTV